MTAEEFRVWRERMGLGKTDAASALGISYWTLIAYEAGRREIGKPIKLACEALLSRKGDGHA